MVLEYGVVSRSSPLHGVSRSSKLPKVVQHNVPSNLKIARIRLRTIVHGYTWRKRRER